MKKLMLLGAGMLLASAVTYAQVDTTSTQQRSTPQQSTPQVQPLPESQDYSKEQRKDQVESKDMTRIKSTEIPAALKQTLQGPEYKGWENSPIYRSKSDNNYVIEIKNGSKTQAYRFGPDGKPIGDY